MTEEQRNEIRDYIEIRVQSTNQTHEALIRQVLKEVNDIKEQVTPVVKFFNNMTFTNQVIWGFLKFLALVGTVIGLIYASILWLKN